MGDTSIEWTNKTWNPVTGCTKVSEGCRHCYAERVFPRTVSGQCDCSHHKSRHDHNSANVAIRCLVPECPCLHFGQRRFTDVLTHSSRLEQPLHWRKPARIFVNSMSDLFHEDVPFEFIKQVWDIAAKAQRHTFQILTKRPERMLAFSRWMAGADDLSAVEWPRNCWLGVSAENQETLLRHAPYLVATPAAVHFISYEPALGPIDLHQIVALDGDGPAKDLSWIGSDARIDWVIVGGESGLGARPMQLEWARSVRRQCKAANVAFFMKQFGRNPMNGAAHYELDIDRGHGGDMSEWPEDLRVREFPA